MALTGSVVALAGCLFFPFVEFRVNRIVNGTTIHLVTVAGPWGWLLISAVVLALAASLAPSRWRGEALLAAGVAAFGALLFSAGGAAVRLTPPGDTPARVSVGAGAWLVLAGVAVVWFQGGRAARTRRATLAALVAVGALMLAAAVWGGLGSLSLAIEYRGQSDTFWLLTWRHVMLTVVATLIAAVIGVPLGILAARLRPVRSAAIPAVGIIQTIPSLALFGLIMVPLAARGLPSIGTLPALIALTLYALLPIVRNTYLGMAGVEPSIIDAGRGMGMGRWALLWRVELPLALPLVLEGLRAALVLTVGIAAVMAIGGAQDLGTLIYLGWGMQADDLVLLGAIPMVLLALVADQSMRMLERSLVSPGIRIQEGRGAL